MSTLTCALLLWQTVAVAQNYLHITSGDSTKIVRMAELDSVTIRDKSFYGLNLSKLDGTRYVNSVVDPWGESFNFNVTLTVDADNTVTINNLDPYFAQFGYVSESGYNILKGTIELAGDVGTATITCQPGQAMGYSDCAFVNAEDQSKPIVFSVTENTLSCVTGYGVYTAGQGGYYTVFNSFTLNKTNSTRVAAPMRRVRETTKLPSLRQKQTMSASVKEDKQTAPMQLMLAPQNQTVE